MQAANLAQQHGIRVYQYDQNGRASKLWTGDRRAGHWIIGPLCAWRAGKPPDTAYVLRDYGASVFH